MQFIKAAMPSSRKSTADLHEQYLRMQQRLSSHSPPRSTSPLSDSGAPDYYPWETRITPPHIVLAEERARRAAAMKAKELAMSPEQKLRMEQAAAAQAEEARLAAAKAAEKAAIARAEREAEAQRRALAEAREQEVAEAAATAAAAAEAEALKNAKELVKMREQNEEKRLEHETSLADLRALKYDRREDLLKRKLGDGILARGLPVESLLKEWDKKETDAMGRADFRQAVRLTLSSMRVVPNDQLDEMFTMLDEFGTGLIIGMQAELGPPLKDICTFAEGEQVREKKLLEQIELCKLRNSLLEDCTTAAEKHEQLEAQQTANQAEPQTLEQKLGSRLDAKLGNGSTNPAALASAFGADAQGMVEKDDFVKYVLSLRTGGELRIEGGERQVVEQLGSLFEKIANGPEQPDDGTDELNEKMDVHAYLNATVANLKEKNEKEEKLQNAINKAQEKAKSLQVAYASEIARKEKSMEMATRIAAGAC